jgi:hypothetical protein
VPVPDLQCVCGCLMNNVVVFACHAFLMARESDTCDGYSSHLTIHFYSQKIALNITINSVKFLSFKPSFGYRIQHLIIHSLSVPVLVLLYNIVFLLTAKIAGKIT